MRAESGYCDYEYPNAAYGRAGNHPGIKKNESGHKFIVISGYRLFEYAQNAIKYGVEDFLLKPINQVELNGALRKICEEKHKLLKQQDDQKQIQSVHHN